MLLKLIKTRSFISGCHCEVWEINHETGNRLLGEVFVLNEHLPLELIYRLTVTVRGICIQGRHCGWRRVRQQDRKDQTAPLIGKGDLCLRSPHHNFPSCVGDPGDVEDIAAYLREVQRSGEEMRIEVCEPTPDLPGYPEVEYHPNSYGEEYTPIIVQPDDNEE